MNPEIKKVWVEELRSGKFQQGRFALNRSDREFCCLGVLCEITLESTGIDKSYNDFSQVAYSSTGSTDNVTAVLPPEVWGLANLDNCNPSFDLSDGSRFYLSELNDTGFSFDQIADVIERFF